MKGLMEMRLLLSIIHHQPCKYLTMVTCYPHFVGKWAARTNIIVLEGRVSEGDEVMLCVGQGCLTGLKENLKGCGLTMTYQLQSQLWSMTVAPCVATGHLGIVGKCMR